MSKQRSRSNKQLCSIRLVARCFHKVVEQHDASCLILIRVTWCRKWCQCATSKDTDADDEPIINLSAIVVTIVAKKRRQRRQMRSCWVHAWRLNHVVYISITDVTLATRIAEAGTLSLAASRHMLNRHALLDNVVVLVWMDTRRFWRTFQ